MKLSTSRGPAWRVETDRLLLRCWEQTDAPHAQPVMARSDAHLRRFVPMTSPHPRTLDETREWLEEPRRQFEADEHYRYVVFDRPGALVGEVLLLDREQTGAREIGYWIDVEQCRKGYATEAAAVMVALAFELDGVDEVFLNCAPRNLGSVGVARNLGFEHVSTRTRTDPVSPDDRESMRWLLTREAYTGSLAARLALRGWDADGQLLLDRGPG